LHVEDVCAAINLITHSGRLNDIYNIGAEDSTKLIDVVDYVMKKTGSKKSNNIHRRARVSSNCTNTKLLYGL
jgi:dTDP-D-glucose 4,6-dehydratase